MDTIHVDQYTFVSLTSQFLIEWEMFPAKPADKITIHILCSMIFFFENRSLYEIMWKHIA